jgi:hypothetical protein
MQNKKEPFSEKRTVPLGRHAEFISASDNEIPKQIRDDILKTVGNILFQ